MLPVTSMLPSMYALASASTELAVTLKEAVVRSVVSRSKSAEEFAPLAVTVIAATWPLALPMFKSADASSLLAVTLRLMALPTRPKTVSSWKSLLMWACASALNSLAKTETSPSMVTKPSMLATALEDSAEAVTSRLPMVTSFSLPSVKKFRLAVLECVASLEYKKSWSMIGVL